MQFFFSNYFHKVYSFEAHPEIFEILRFNTRNNKNINVFNIALFNKIEKMFIIIDQIANYGASHISKNFCPQSQQNAFELETKVFSDIFPNLNIKKKISFIKLDVEGVEQEVLQGFKNILSVDSPIICFEQHLKDFKDENNKFTTKMINFLREFDYDHFYEIDSSRNWKFVNETYSNYISIFFKVFEMLFYGLPERRYKPKKIIKFSIKKYSSIIASKQELL